MKRFLFALIALMLVPIIVFGQNAPSINACGSYAKNIGSINITYPTQFAFPCAPASLGGTGSMPRVERHNGGFVAWNYCTDGFSYTWQFGVITDAEMTDATLLSDYLAVQFASDKVQALNDFTKKHATVPINDPTLLPIWCPAIHEIVASTPAPIPYIVMPDPAGATYRTTYYATTARNGTRILPSQGGKIAIKQSDGTPTRCNCMASRVIEGKQAYCNVDTNQPLYVAACVKQ